MYLNHSQIKRLSKKLKGNIPEILFAYLFGSSVSGTIKNESDIDLAVYLAPGKKTFDTIARIFGVMEDQFPSQQIDIVLLNDSGIIISMEVLKGKLLFVREDAWDIYSGYYSLTCRNFEDHMIWIKKQLKYRGYEVQWSD